MRSPEPVVLRVWWNRPEVPVKNTHRQMVCVCVSNCLQPQGLQNTGLLSPWNFPSKHTGVGSQFLLQRIFPAPRIKPSSLVSPALTSVPPGKPTSCITMCMTMICRCHLKRGVLKISFVGAHTNHLLIPDLETDKEDSLLIDRKEPGSEKCSQHCRHLSGDGNKWKKIRRPGGEDPAMCT